MTTEYHWEIVKTFEATDDKGNSYQIDQEEKVATIHAISGLDGPRTTRGLIRFRCEGQPVQKLPNGKFNLVQRGIILAPCVPE